MQLIYILSWRLECKCIPYELSGKYTGEISSPGALWIGGSTCDNKFISSIILFSWKALHLCNTCTNFVIALHRTDGYKGETEAVSCQCWTQRPPRMRPLWTSLPLLLASLLHAEGDVRMVLILLMMSCFAHNIATDAAARLHALLIPGYTCPSGKSKETITLAVGESVDFSTQETDTYGKNVRCQVKFKVRAKWWGIHFQNLYFCF